MRPGGRTHRNTVAIHRAVLQLLESRGLEFTFQEIAEISGVSRRTIHRRWGDKNAVLTDALDHHYRQFKAKSSGNLHADLQSYLRAFRDFSGTPLELAINGIAAASRDTSFARANADIWRYRRDTLTEILQHAQERGDITPTANLGVLQLQFISPIMTAASIIREPMTDADIETLIDQTLKGVLRSSA